MSDTAANPGLPMSIAHRGLSAHAPENTLAAVRAAHEAGCRWVELDVQLLSDGTPVIWHDPGLQRCSTGRGKLHLLNLESAQQLDVGSWFGAPFVGERMATLEAMLALISKLEMGLNLEIKVCRGRDAEALVNAAVPLAMSALPVERLIVSSFSTPALKAMRRLEPNPEYLRLGILYEKPPADWHDAASILGAYSLHIDWRRLKENTARQIVASPFRLFCYTVNDSRVFSRLCKWQVDGVISDDPIALLR